MNIFVDTSAFYAVLSRTDANYEKASADWNKLIDDESITFYTSNYIIVEACALIRNRLGDGALRAFLENLLPLAVVLWVDQKVHASAIEAMIVRGKNGPSMVDCSSFALMRENGIPKALAYDKHFSAQGF
ncbi:MAG: type II toxin-antitoxin system VapC family toxin [Armatimonadota bacterium]